MLNTAYGGRRIGGPRPRELAFYNGVFIGSRRLIQVKNCLDIYADTVLMKYVISNFVTTLEQGCGHFRVGFIGYMIRPLNTDRLLRAYEILATTSKKKKVLFKYQEEA